MTLKLSFLALSLMLLSCNNQTIPVYVGTYTNQNSEGIYKFMFNTKTGDLSDLQLVAKTENPSFIAFSPNKAYLYAVNEAENGTVAAFKVEDDGSLTFINQEKSFGGAPCHVSVNQAGTKVVASNYVGGNISLYNTNKNGSLTEASQIFDHNTDSIKSHAHSAKFLNNKSNVVINQHNTSECQY